MQPMEDVLGELASAADLAGESVESLESAAADRGADLRGLGINMVLAPVVDVGSAGGIGDRSFGDTSEVVTAKAGAYARGLREGGVLPVLKHFPGQGHADADTHESVGDRARSWRCCAPATWCPTTRCSTRTPVGVMVGHLDVPDLTESGLPASVSPAAIGLLRGGYEFDGLVMTDDLAAMQAILSRFSVARGGRARAGGRRRRAAARAAHRRGAGARSPRGGGEPGSDPQPAPRRRAGAGRGDRLPARR